MTDCRRTRKGTERRHVCRCVLWCRFAFCIIVAGAVSACAAKRQAAPLTPTPAPTPAQRLASADALLHAGCLDCLVDAFGEYELLRQFPAANDAATAGAIRAAGLIARRERELGMVDGGYAQRARSLLSSGASVPASLATLFDVIDALPASGGGLTRTPTSDIDLERQRMLRVNGDLWTATLKALAPVDELGAYMWLAFACGATDMRDKTIDQLFEPVAPFKDTPLIAMKRATCRAVVPDRLKELAAANLRFNELTYWQGLYAVGQRHLNEADKLFDEAYAWRQQWPSLTQSIANVAMTSEEFERALAFYDKTLELEPKAVDALIGRVRALTFLGKAEDAIATTDRLIAIGWYVGDARYWRAFNENELERYDEAWADIEAAAKLQINADVPKLAGLIAYRRQQLDVSRSKFEQAHTRNKNDCETFFYMGIVNAELGAWAPTAEILPNAATCLQVNEDNYRREIASIEASDDPPARKAGKIARREQYIAKGRRQIATSYFDTAVACYNLSRKSEAQQYAEKVAADEQFAARAKEILARLR